MKSVLKFVLAAGLNILHYVFWMSQLVNNYGVLGMAFGIILCIVFGLFFLYSLGMFSTTSITGSSGHCCGRDSGFDFDLSFDFDD